MAELYKCAYCYKKRATHNMEKHIAEEHPEIKVIHDEINSICEVSSYNELETRLKDIFELFGLELNISKFDLQKDIVDLKDTFWGSEQFVLNRNYTKEELEVKYHPVFKLTLSAQAIVVDPELYSKTNKSTSYTFSKTDIFNKGYVSIGHKHYAKKGDILSVSINNVYLLAKMFPNLSKVYFSKDVNHMLMTDSIQRDFNEMCKKIKEEYDYKLELYIKENNQFVQINEFIKEAERLVIQLKNNRADLDSHLRNDFKANHKIKMPELTSPYLNLNAYNNLRQQLSLSTTSTEIISSRLVEYTNTLLKLTEKSKIYSYDNPEQFL